MALAREAGHRTKIAVKANDPSINAKGACIGELGRRVRAVTEELAGEKIDIVDYDADLPTFVAHAYLREGLLEEVPVGGAAVMGGDLMMLYPSSGQTSKKVTAFRDFLVESLRSGL